MATKSIKKQYIFMFSIFVLYFLRLIHIDADVISYALNQINPIDEMYYNEVAINIYNQGFIDSLRYGVGEVTIPNAKTYLLPNILTGLCLRVFGKTYLGLRFSSVVWGLVGLIFLYIILNLVLKHNSASKMYILFGVLLYLFDFNVLMLTRSAITIIPCMVAELIILYFYLRFRDDCYKKSFVLAFGSLTAFCIVYMGVPFFILAAFLITCRNLIVNKDKQERIKSFWGYIAGNVCAFIVTEIMALIFVREHIWKVVLATFSGFSYKIAESVDILSRLAVWKNTALEFWTSNMFRYSPIMLCMFALSLVLFFLKKREEFDYVALLFVLSHWAQTIVLENATASKATISYGMILVYCIYSLSKIELLNWGQRAKWILCGGLVCILILVARIVAFSYKESASIFSNNEINTFIVATYVIGVVIIGAFVFWKKRSFFLSLSMAIAVLINMIFSFKYVYGHCTYSDKEACMQLAAIVGEDQIIGGFPLGFSLYNECEIGIGAYERYTEHGMDVEYVNKLYKSCIEGSEDLYFIGHISGFNGGCVTIDEINQDILKDSPYYFKEIYLFERNYYAYTPGDNYYILYKKVIK